MGPAVWPDVGTMAFEGQAHVCPPLYKADTFLIMYVLHYII